MDVAATRPETGLAGEAVVLAGSPGPPGADFAVLGGLGSGVGGGVVGGVGSGVGGGVVGGVRASGGVLCAGPGLLM
jgi:hypothetical protein